MLTGPVAGRFLELLVWFGRPKHVLEIGTFSGHSALAMAAALPEDGHIDACEIDPDRAAFAQRYFDRSPHGSKITLHVGPAIETIERLEGELRPRLHRRRQARLRRLLRSGAAASLRARPDRRRQHARRRARRRRLGARRRVQRARCRRPALGAGAPHRPGRDHALSGAPDAERAGHAEFSEFRTRRRQEGRPKGDIHGTPIPQRRTRPRARQDSSTAREEHADRGARRRSAGAATNDKLRTAFEDASRRDRASTSSASRHVCSEIVHHPERRALQGHGRP